MDSLAAWCGFSLLDRQETELQSQIEKTNHGCLQPSLLLTRFENKKSDAQNRSRSSPRLFAQHSRRSFVTIGKHAQNGMK